MLMRRKAHVAGGIGSGNGGAVNCLAVTCTTNGFDLRQQFPGAADSTGADTLRFSVIEESGPPMRAREGHRKLY
jgi:hypothetical protein